MKTESDVPEKENTMTLSVKLAIAGAVIWNVVMGWLFLVLPPPPEYMRPDQYPDWALLSGGYGCTGYYFSLTPVWGLVLFYLAHRSLPAVRIYLRTYGCCIIAGFCCALFTGYYLYHPDQRVLRCGYPAADVLFLLSLLLAILCTLLTLRSVCTQRNV